MIPTPPHGKSPPNSAQCSQVPMIGMPRVIEHRRPQADAREQVVGQRVAEEALEHGQDQQQRADHPVGLAGPRNAPVKKMRARWTMIAAANISAAQWWTCRTNSPPRTSKLMSSAEA